MYLTAETVEEVKNLIAMHTRDSWGYYNIVTNLCGKGSEEAERARTEWFTLTTLYRKLFNEEVPYLNREEVE